MISVPKPGTQSTARVTVAGRTVTLCATDRFPVTPYTRFLVEHLPDVKGQQVLDLGTGSGAVAIAAALAGAASVVACDIDPNALQIVEGNAKRLKCLQVATAQVHRNSVRSLKGKRFDTILCNPASLPTTNRQNPFYSGGKYGVDMISHLIRVAKGHLVCGGCLCFVHTSLASLHRSLRQLAAARMAAGILATSFVPFRDHYGDLYPYFSSLRADGEIFFATIEGKPCEILYLIVAKHFKTEERDS